MFCWVQDRFLHWLVGGLFLTFQTSGLFHYFPMEYIEWLYGILTLKLTQHLLLHEWSSNIKTKKLFSEFLSQTFNSSQKRNHIKFIDINYHMCWLRVLRRNSVNTFIICNKNNNHYQDFGWGRVELLGFFSKMYNRILYAVWTSDTKTQMCM